MVLESPAGRRFDTCWFVVPRQVDDPEAGSVALLRIGTCRQYRFYELRSRCAGLSRPLDKAGWIPFSVVAVFRRHVLWQGGVTAPDVRPDMGGDTLPFVEHFYHTRGQPDVHSLVQQLVGDAVVMVVYLDVVIQVHFGLIPFGIFVGLLGQQQGIGTVYDLEKLAAGLPDPA